MQYVPGSKALQILINPDNFVGVFNSSEKNWIKQFCNSFDGVKYTFTLSKCVVTFDKEETMDEFLKRFYKESKNV